VARRGGWQTAAGPSGRVAFTRYPAAERLVPVLDTLNAHTLAARHAALVHEEAHRLNAWLA